MMRGVATRTGVLLALGTLALVLLLYQIWSSDGASPASDAKFSKTAADETSSERSPLSGAEVDRIAEPSAENSLTAPPPPSPISPVKAASADRKASVLLFGKIIVAPSGTMAPPEVRELSFLNSSGARRVAQLHSDQRYSCTAMSPGSCVALVLLSSNVSCEVEFEIKEQVSEQREDLQVQAPFHATIAVDITAPNGRRLLEELAEARVTWNPLLGIEPFGYWVAASEDELPPILHVDSATQRNTVGIGRWWPSVHIMSAHPHDGTLDLLRWAPRTHVALYWRDRRVDAQSFQLPPEKLVFVTDPSAVRDAEPASISFRCLNAVDGTPLGLMQFENSVTRESRFLPLAEGRARIDGLAPGAYVFELRPIGLMSQRMEIELAPGETRDLGDLVFARGRALQLRAFDRDGTPLRGTVLSVPVDEKAALSNSSAKQSFDSDGRAKLQGLTPAFHRVLLERSEGAKEQARFFVDLSAGDIEDLELHWPAEEFPLDLHVYLEPWQEAFIEVLDGEERRLMRWRSSGRSQRTFQLPPGHYRCQLIAEDGALLDEAQIELPAATPRVRLRAK